MNPRSSGYEPNALPLGYPAKLLMVEMAAGFEPATFDFAVLVQLSFTTPSQPDATRVSLTLHVINSRFSQP